LQFQVNFFFAVEKQMKTGNDGRIQTAAAADGFLAGGEPRGLQTVRFTVQAAVTTLLTTSVCGASSGCRIPRRNAVEVEIALTNDDRSALVL
jgi:hypothetical protein